ncbi:uncharacterized protein DUF397 [Actinocorallia herbida]|uniref:Uncharacterized protein DUF397 n=1 Tax=Actinocorallia herbida TaxID=58109 RepID=A0A3N1D742_9ACTN|nr:DUF397 domain-containing protein [Actinocorallia herbida]ROO88928.1 uncharacterized protein DUF397 [Actinocorallia herbida]
MTIWRKSSYTGGGNDQLCVEVARLGRGIGLRDSKNPAGARLEVSRGTLSELFGRVKHGGA